MPLKSLRVTRKEIDTFYNPKVNDFQLMIDSINYVGYGQIIQNYSNVGVLNTYYHVYSTVYNQMVVYNPTNGIAVIVVEAGPTFWGVSAQEGLDFLEGTGEIPGYRKLKYCNNCEDNNGLSYPTIDNFKSRFRELSNLVYNYGTLDGFLFYDLDQPRYTNVYPSVKYDDGINLIYFFKTIYGTNRSLEEMSLDTGYSTTQIETSITTAPIIKPQEGNNSVITPCCGGNPQVIFGQRPIGSILYNSNMSESYCWYVESLTNSDPTVPISEVFSDGGRSCQFCITTHGCPPVCETISLAYSTNPADVCLQLYDDYFIAYNVSKLYEFGNCGGTVPPSGYYADRKGFIYYWDGITFSEYGRCPSNLIIQACCSGQQLIISGSFNVGDVIYTKDVNPAVCFEVISTTSDSPTSSFNFFLWRTDCTECIQLYPGGCKK